MEKWYKYMDGYPSQDLLYQKIHPLPDAAFGADCLTSFNPILDGGGGQICPPAGFLNIAQKPLGLGS